MVVLNSVIVITAVTCFAILMVIVLTGFGLVDRDTEYKLDNANISFSLPKIWEVTEKDKMAVSLSKDNADMRVSVYKKWDLDGSNPTALLDSKIKEELAASDVEYYEMVKDYGTDVVMDRTIYARLYSVEKEGIQRQYYFSVMEFADSATLVYTLYETSESHMKYHISDINRMLVRMKWNGEEIDLVMN
jgi:hypothetical protein